MLESALKNGKLFLETPDTWAVKNWRKYQEDQTNSERQAKHKENVSNGEPRYQPLLSGNNAYGTVRDETLRDRTEGRKSARARTSDQPPSQPGSNSPPPGRVNPDMAKRLGEIKLSPPTDAPPGEYPDMARLFEQYETLRDEFKHLKPSDDLTHGQRETLAQTITEWTFKANSGEQKHITVDEVIDQLKKSNWILDDPKCNFGLHWLCKHKNLTALLLGDWTTGFNREEQGTDEYPTPPEQEFEMAFRNFGMNDMRMVKVPKVNTSGNCTLCHKHESNCECHLTPLAKYA